MRKILEAIGVVLICWGLGRLFGLLIALLIIALSGCAAPASQQEPVAAPSCEVPMTCTTEPQLDRLSPTWCIDNMEDMSRLCHYAVPPCNLYLVRPKCDGDWVLWPNDDCSLSEEGVEPTP